MSASTVSPAPRPPLSSRPRAAPPPPGLRKDPMGVMADLVSAADGALGLVLWRALRDVYLWAGTPPGERAGCPPGPELAERLAEARERAPDLVDALAVFARLAVAPAQAGAAAVAQACHQVCEWARMEHRAETAVYFAEAAATADPDSPAHANEAGRECRRAALHERSAVWYQRGFRLAVAAKDRDAVLQALLGYGRLMYNLGRYREASSWMEQAARRAARTGRRRKAGEAYHDLLTIASEAGTYTEGERHARKALELYPSRHPRIPHLAHDFGRLLVRHRLYSSVLPLLRRALPLIDEPDARVLVWSNVGRAAAGTGQQALYREAKRKVLELAPGFQQFAPAALVNIAEGARACGEWEEAEQHLATALRIARARKDADIERAALALAPKVKAREPAERETVPPPGSHLESLLRQLTAKLHQWSAPARRSGEADRVTGW